MIVSAAMSPIRCLLVPMVVFFSFALISPASAQNAKVPFPYKGWAVTSGGGLKIVEVPLNKAPKLAPWAPHGQADTALLPSSLPGEQEIGSLIDESLRIVGDYLPRPYSGAFRLWIFGDVPYAARTEKTDVVLSSRLLKPQEDQRLPWVLAHELHHLALIHTGLAAAPSSPQNRILTGLLMEGVATWMCWSSGFFPELDQVLSDSPDLRESFSRLNAALAGENPESAGADLYEHNKWGYYAGSWMVRKIHERFGKQSWLTLLEQNDEEAGRRLVDLYQRTQPPPEYSLR